MSGYFFFPIEFPSLYHREKKKKLYFKVQKDPNRKRPLRCSARGMSLSGMEARGQGGSLTSQGAGTHLGIPALGPNDGGWSLGISREVILGISGFC